MHSSVRCIVVGAVLAVTLSACEKIDSGPFLGKWRYTSGYVQQTCNGSTDSSTPEGEAVMTVGTKTDLLFTYNNCSIGYDLPYAGNGASAQPQSCGGDLLSVNVKTSSMSITNDMLHQRENGTFIVFGTTCTYNTDAYLTRVAETPAN